MNDGVGRRVCVGNLSAEEWVDGQTLLLGNVADDDFIEIRREDLAAMLPVLTRYAETGRVE